MFMRLLQLKINPDHKDMFEGFYDKIVIPALQKMKGCQFAGLIQSQENPEYFVSMTLWNSYKNAEGYEKSGVFRELLDNSKPFLAETMEWKVQLSENLEVQYAPQEESPELREYKVTAEAASNQQTSEIKSLYVRMLSAKIRPGKLNECRTIYKKEIAPLLNNAPGCLFAYLVEGMQAKDEIISLTIWKSPQDAKRFESDGLFDRALNKVVHTFSSLYQWKMELEKEMGGKMRTSDDVKLSGYSMVSGKRFDDRIV